MACSCFLLDEKKKIRAEKLLVILEMHSLMKAILSNQKFIEESLLLSLLPVCFTPQDRQLFIYLKNNDSFQRELGGQNTGWGQIFQVPYNALLWMGAPRKMAMSVLKSLHDQLTSRTWCEELECCQWRAKLSLAVFKSLDSYLLPTHSLDLIYCGCIYIDESFWNVST